MGRIIILFDMFCVIAGVIVLVHVLLWFKKKWNEKHESNKTKGVTDGKMD